MVEGKAFKLRRMSASSYRLLLSVSIHWEILSLFMVKYYVSSQLYSTKKLEMQGYLHVAPKIFLQFTGHDIVSTLYKNNNNHLLSASYVPETLLGSSHTLLFHLIL